MCVFVRCTGVTGTVGCCVAASARVAVSWPQAAPENTKQQKRIIVFTQAKISIPATTVKRLLGSSCPFTALLLYDRLLT